MKAKKKSREEMEILNAEAVRIYLECNGNITMHELGKRVGFCIESASQAITEYFGFKKKRIR